MNLFSTIQSILINFLFPAYPGPAGVGAYAYQDSSGRRYGGTYDLKDDFNPFSDPFAAPFNDVDAFFPDYFRNFENILQQ